MEVLLKILFSESMNLIPVVIFLFIKENLLISLQITMFGKVANFGFRMGILKWRESCS